MLEDVNIVEGNLAEFLQRSVGFAREKKTIDNLAVNKNNLAKMLVNIVPEIERQEQCDGSRRQNL